MSCKHRLACAFSIGNGSLREEFVIIKNKMAIINQQPFKKGQIISVNIDGKIQKAKAMTDHNGGSSFVFKDEAGNIGIVGNTSQVVESKTMVYRNRPNKKEEITNVVKIISLDELYKSYLSGDRKTSSFADELTEDGWIIYFKSYGVKPDEFICLYAINYEVYIRNGKTQNLLEITDIDWYRIGYDVKAIKLGIKAFDLLFGSQGAVGFTIQKTFSPSDSVVNAAYVGRTIRANLIYPLRMGSFFQISNDYGIAYYSGKYFISNYVRSSTGYWNYEELKQESVLSSTPISEDPNYTGDEYRLAYSWAKTNYEDIKDAYITINYSGSIEIPVIYGSGAGNILEGQIYTSNPSDPAPTTLTSIYPFYRENYSERIYRSSKEHEIDKWIILPNGTVEKYKGNYVFNSERIRIESFKITVTNVTYSILADQSWFYVYPNGSFIQYMLSSFPLNIEGTLNESIDESTSEITTFSLTDTISVTNEKIVTRTVTTQLLSIDYEQIPDTGDIRVTIEIESNESEIENSIYYHPLIRFDKNLLMFYKTIKQVININSNSFVSSKDYSICPFIMVGKRLATWEWKFSPNNNGSGSFGYNYSSHFEFTELPTNNYSFNWNGVPSDKIENYFICQNAEITHINCENDFFFKFNGVGSLNPTALFAGASLIVKGYASVSKYGLNGSKLPYRYPISVSTTNGIKPVNYTLNEIESVWDNFINREIILMTAEGGIYYKITGTCNSILYKESENTLTQQQTNGKIVYRQIEGFVLTVSAVTVEKFFGWFNYDDNGTYVFPSDNQFHVINAYIEAYNGYNLTFNKNLDIYICQQLDEPTIAKKGKAYIDCYSFNTEKQTFIRQALKQESYFKATHSPDSDVHISYCPK